MGQTDEVSRQNPPPLTPKFSSPSPSKISSFRRHCLPATSMSFCSVRLVSRLLLYDVNSSVPPPIFAFVFLLLFFSVSFFCRCGVAILFLYSPAVIRLPSCDVSCPPAFLFFDIINDVYDFCFLKDVRTFLSCLVDMFNIFLSMARCSISLTVDHISAPYVMV